MERGFSNRCLILRPPFGDEPIESSLPKAG